MTPLSGPPVSKDKQVNIVQTTEEGHHGEKVKMKNQKLPYRKKHQLARMIPPRQNILIYCPPVLKNMTPVITPIIMND